MSARKTFYKTIYEKIPHSNSVDRINARNYQRLINHTACCTLLKITTYENVFIILRRLLLPKRWDG